jgi:hypothetical protein
MFKLQQKSINPVVAKFHVVNQAGEVVGSVNVPPAEVSALLKHWAGPVERPAARISASPRISVPGMKFGKLRPMSRQAILRGCL